MIPDLPWLLFAVALLTGGLVKGALGVGLPLVAVPLLSLGMPPHLAIALLVVPVLASNFWQAVEGGRLVPSLQRFGGLIAAQFLATVLTVRMTLALSASQLSAMLGGVSSLTGPVIITYLMALRLRRDEFVGSISIIYLSAALPLYGAMLLFGRLGPTELTGSLLALVPMAAGLLAGKALRQHLDDNRFRRVLLVFLIVLAILLLLK